MPIKAESTSFQGASYKLNTLGAVEGLRVFGLLSGALAEPLGAMAGSWAKGRAGSGGEALENASQDPKELEAMATQVLKSLGNPAVQDAVRTMLDGLQRDAKPINFDTFFAGNYGPLVHLVPWALRINFGGFLGAFQGGQSQE